MLPVLLNTWVVTLLAGLFAHCLRGTDQRKTYVALVETSICSISSEEVESHEGSLAALRFEWRGRRLSFSQAACALRNGSSKLTGILVAVGRFTRAKLWRALRGRLPPIIVRGMNGMGDNIHQRAVVRELARYHEVWLQTPWPCFYHDMPIHLLRPATELRTQSKNAQREAAKYDALEPRAKMIKVHYPAKLIRKRGSMLAAMSAVCRVPVGGFSMPVPQAWRDLVAVDTDKPILVYRPLVERTEWGGCKNRNPDPDAYKALFEAVRGRFFVVSVADLMVGREWLAGHPVSADLEYHAGELTVEGLAGLIKRASLVFTSPGFAAPLAQAVGTPVITVFGGYENSRAYLSGNPTPFLGIDTVKPCQCYSERHECEKRIDLEVALRQIEVFISANCRVSDIHGRGIVRI